MESVFQFEIIINVSAFCFIYTFMLWVYHTLHLRYYTFLIL